MVRAIRFVIGVGALIAILPSAVAGQMRGQPGFVEPTRPPSTFESITALLQSPSAREQAWGAWFASTNVFRELAPLLQRVVELRARDESLEGRAAFDVAVDALIQLNVRVPEPLVRIVHDRSEAAAVILASFNSEVMTDYLLEVVDRSSTEVWFGAANLLIRPRTIDAEPRGFAAVLLRPLSIGLEIYVRDTDDVGIEEGMGGGSGVGCGAIGAAPGLPPWPTYSVTTHVRAGVVVHAAGPTPTYYQRAVTRAGLRPADSVRIRNLPRAEDRLRYLAALAHLENPTMQLRAVEWHSVKWQSEEHLRETIERLRAAIIEKHALLLHLLQHHGVLSEDEAASLPPLAIEVAVHDRREVK